MQIVLFQKNVGFLSSLVATRWRKTRLLSEGRKIGMMPALGMSQTAYMDGSLTWAALQDKITNATSGSTVALTGDMTAEENDTAFTLPE